MIRTALLLALCLSGAAGMEAKAPVPRPAPDFELVEPGSTPKSFASYTGKVLVVQFLSTACQRCQAFSGELAQLQEEFGGQGFQALGVAFLEADPERAAAYKARFAQNAFPVVYAPEPEVLKLLGLSVMERYGVPQVVVIDKNGIIRAQTTPIPDGTVISPGALRNWITRLLAE